MRRWLLRRAGGHLPVLRDQPLLTQELGRRARERVMERYRMVSNIDALEELYDTLIAKKALAA